MDTKLNTSIKTNVTSNIQSGKKIKAFLYRAVAIGALFTMIFSGIMGREALVNLNHMGANALSGDIYYLTDFREYITDLYLQAMTGYAGVGDDNGFPQTDQNIRWLSEQCLRSFHTSTEYAKNLMFYLDDDGIILESGNVSYPLFSAYDGHLMLPEDVTLCIYWDGPNETLHFFDGQYSSGVPKNVLDRYSDLQYRPNMENASQIRFLLAVQDTDSYTTSRLARFDSLAKDYQRALIVFFASLALFLVASFFCLLSFKTAKQMWKDYAAIALKLWMECKLIVMGLVLYLCYHYQLWDLSYPLSYRRNLYNHLWIYLPTGILLYLFCKDLCLNKADAWKHSMLGSILHFTKEYVSGIKWYRKVMSMCLVTLLGGLTMLAAGIAQLFMIASGYYIISDVRTILTVSGWILCIVGVLLLLAYIGLRHFTKDAHAISTKLSELRQGTSKEPVILPDKSLLCQAAADLNALENGIEAAVEQQNRSNRMRVELITNVSHDLKTPLTSIINYADLLCEENLPAPAAEYACALQSKAYRLKSMVQDVFELSKATSGNLPVEKTVLDLAKLLKQTLADMDERILDSTLTFRLNIATEPILIEADGEKLYRIFQNLIVNALQYSLENSRVHIQLGIENGFAHAKVKNTSRLELDFDPEEIVERFVRADSSRTTEGSGLGLSIVQSFTEACGGSFHITTDADMFTACVSFPLADVPAVSPTETPTAVSTAAPTDELVEAAALDKTTIEGCIYDHKEQ